MSAAHHVELGTGWRLWKWALVRGSGFPAVRLLEFAAPVVSKRIAAFNQHRTDTERASAVAIASAEALAPTRATNKALRWLRRGELPPNVEALGSIGAELSSVAVGIARQREAEELAGRALEESLERAHTMLRRVAAEPRFREAVTWQNRGILKSTLEPLAGDRHAFPSSTKSRRKAALVARYLQRYCAKNETIGFFGPIGFGELVPKSVSALRVTPGPTFVNRRRVYFEHWCVDAIAAAFTGLPQLRRHARPRRAPRVRLEGTTLHYGVDKTAKLDRDFAALLARCDGQATAVELADELVGLDVGVDDRDEAFDLLAELEEQNLIFWAFEVPTVARPGEPFQKQLIDVLALAGPAGKAAQAVVSEIDALREDAAAAAGDPVRLNTALAALEATFERHAQVASQRRSGQAYAGRTLVHEECRRDVEVEIGPPLLERVEGPISLILEGARWFTHRVAQAYRELATDLFDAIAGEASEVPYLAFWRRLAPHMPAYPEVAPLVATATNELQRRWGEILHLQPGARRIELTTTQLRPAVAALFEAPHPGWPGARFHSPDLMIAAPDVATIDAGGGLFVLGELHPAVNTFHLIAQREHPDPDLLIRAREIDVPDPVAVPVIAKEHATRADHVWLSRQNVDIELGSTRSWRPRDEVVAISELVVERRPAGLVVRDRGGKHAFDVVAFFDATLSSMIAPEYRMFPEIAHRPRVSIDDVVVAREQWRLEPDDLAFASARGLACHADTHRFAAKLGLPRWVFVRIPEEPKPVYVDFQSPTFVDALARLARKGSSMTITEMLPTLSETWLKDAQGQAYTSEIRFVAVDPRSWVPPA